MNDETIDALLDANKDKQEKKATVDHNKEADHFLKEIKSFENDRVELAMSSKKTAWKVTAGSCFITLLLAIAIIVLVPLKTVDYRLLMVNKDTGMTEIVQPMQDAKTTTYGEVMDKYWINKFIIERNAYQWLTVQDSYDFVALASNNQVFGAYQNYIRAESSPVEIFKDSRKVKVSDISISFLPTQQDKNLAQISFVKSVVNNNDAIDTDYRPTRWTATITYDYKKEITKSNDRLLNPLGFQVTSYREDRIQ